MSSGRATEKGETGDSQGENVTRKGLTHTSTKYIVFGLALELAPNSGGGRMAIRRKRSVVLAVCLAALAVVAAPVPVGAQTVPSDVIRFGGSADIVDATATCATAAGDGALCWVGGSGEYTFDDGSSPDCNGISTPDLSPPTESVIRDCDIDHAATVGTFTNTVCGTGTAGTPGTSTIEVTEIVALGPPRVTETLTVSYTITFVGSVGVITGTVTEVTTGSIAGVVQISASPGIIPPDTGDTTNFGPCATGFTVEGVATTFQGVA